MIFNSPLFLFVFLPVFIVLYWLAGKKLRNTWLLVGSLFFYLWGEPLFFPVILTSILLNYLFGRWIEDSQANERRRRNLLALSITLNLALLVFFKFVVTYWSPFLPVLEKGLGLTFPGSLRLYLAKFLSFPLGMSFFTFAVVSYCIDVYKNRVPAERSLFKLSLYVLMYPKVIAGPIVRYMDMGKQIGERLFSPQDLANGARRFIGGLAKKALIADQLGLLVGQGVFDQAAPNLSTGTAWLVLLCYSLQIIFDFSGYTDMAIGLGQMLGFRFVENFNYPYISKSISEFWRRWHISLSSWFRDYLFYPLERRRSCPLQQYANILFVFLMTGLWHGLTLNFAAWGLVHGLAIALERTRFGRWLGTTWAPIQHLYTLLVLAIGWVLFCSHSLGFALTFLKTLLGFTQGAISLPYSVMPPVQTSTWLALMAGVLFSMPVASTLGRLLGRLFPSPNLQAPSLIVQDALSLGLLAVSVIVLASSTFQPYIYGNF
jgi:alginate O-acetyltransferase complex protein AlgI